MTATFEIEWKISGLLPTPIADDCKYYQKTEHRNYSKRNFGRPDIQIPSTTLAPTKLFHQALRGELGAKYGLNWPSRSQPYWLPITELGNQPVNLRFRVFGGAVLVLTIQLPPIAMPISIKDLIQFQMLSSHPVLESVARFCFNVHYCPAPSQAVIKAWQSKPLMKIRETENPFAKSTLAALVTRHEGLNDRATAEVIAKNEKLNFNEDTLFVDKQGVVFLNTTADKNDQRNRYGRISALYEYAVHVKSVENIFAEGNTDSIERVVGEIESINQILVADVLSQSVSARRVWELIKEELRLGTIASYGHTDDQIPQKNNERIPFYKEPLFIGISALLVLAASIVTVLKFFGLKGL